MTKNIEKELVRQWAGRNSNQNQSFFDFRDNKRDSYFTKSQIKRNVESYGFDNLQMLEDQLAGLWSEDQVMEEVVKVCAIAAFKGQPRDRSSNKIETETTLEVPEFTYAF